MYLNCDIVYKVPAVPLKCVEMFSSYLFTNFNLIITEI